MKMARTGFISLHRPVAADVKRRFGQVFPSPPLHEPQGRARHSVRAGVPHDQGWHARSDAPYQPSSPQNIRASGKKERGFLMVDLLVGISILAIAILPLAFSFTRQTRLLRDEYFRAAAMEIVDGEMEILAAGEGKNFPEGVQTYEVHSATVTNLPPGKFQLTKTASHLRLEWKADKRRDSSVVREVTLK